MTRLLEQALEAAFLTVQRVERDDGAGGEAEFGKQRLGCRNFVGLHVDVDMCEQQRGIGGKRAQHLGGGAVTKVVEAAAQRLAVQRDGALFLRCADGSL